MSTVFDAMLALTISAGVLVQADSAAVRATQVSMAVQTGQYMYGLQQGINKFIAVNGDQLSGRSAATYTDAYGNATTFANPMAPTMAELVAAKFLPVGWSTTAPVKGMNFAVSVTPTNCPGAGCTVPAYITSTPYKDQQGNVRNDLMAYAVSKAGLDGGLALSSNPGSFTSLGKTWSQASAAAQPGALMMRAGVLTTGYVDTLPYYKNDGTRPLTGTMQANGHNITGAGTIAASAMTTSTLSASGAITSGSLSTGNINANGITANAIALPGGNALTIANSQWYGDSANAAIRTPGALFLQGLNGAGWAGLNAGSGSFSGNVNVTGQASANTMVANGITSNGNIGAAGQVSGNTMVANGITSNGNINAGNNISANTMNANGITSNGDILAAGNSTVNGVLTARNVVNLPALAYAGWGCSGNAVTTDPTGQLLSCQSGVWRAATTNNNYYTTTNSYPTTYVQPSQPYVVGFNGSCTSTDAVFSNGTTQRIWTASYDCGGGGAN